MRRVIIAAGGGNDVFTALAYATQPDDIVVGVLGLTPFHTSSPVDLAPGYHYAEDPIIYASPTMTRYLCCDPPKKIYCNEALLPAGTPCLSPKWPPSIVASTLAAYLTTLQCDATNTIVELVDFGGDILTNGEQSSIISPLLDAFSLAVVRLLPYSKRLLVFFPGVDGELPNDYLRRWCTNPIPQTVTLPNLLRSWELIKKQRPGNTIPNIIAHLEGRRDYKLTKHWPGKKWSKTLELDENLLKYGWEIDIDKVNNPFCPTDDDDLLDRLARVEAIYQQQGVSGVQLTDLYCSYLRKDSKGRWTNRELIDGQEVRYIPMGSKYIVEHWTDRG